MNLFTSSIQTLAPMSAVIPSLIVSLAAIASMLAEAFREKGERMPIGGLGIIGLAGSAIACALLWDRDVTSFGVVRADNFALFVQIVLALVGVLTILFSSQVLEREELPGGEYYALTLFGVSGMMLMAAATDLLVIFLALEIFSLAVYVLTGIRRTSAAGGEAAFKYFVLGSFSSAFFLYGVAFTFAVTGTTRLELIGATLAAQALEPNPLALLAVGLLLVGFAFKVSAVPFHMWTPDAYQGAPTVVTGFMAAGVKAAAFAAFVRVFLSTFEPLRGEWIPLVWLMSAVTMVGGTVIGVVQTNVKRLLAYSSIAHAGYLLIGLVAANAAGKAAVLFYLLAYAMATLGAFGVVALLVPSRAAEGKRGLEPSDGELADFAGLWHRQPVLAALMTTFLLSLGGLPPTAGFVGKWYIFTAAVQGGYYWLAIIAVLTSVASVFFYLRIVVMMYMADAATERHPALSRTALAALTFTVLAVFYLGILPTRFLDLAAASISTIF